MASDIQVGTPNAQAQNLQANPLIIAGGAAAVGAAGGAGASLLSRVKDDEFVNSAKRIIDKKVGTNWGDAFAQFKKAILFGDERAIRKLASLNPDLSNSPDELVKEFGDKKEAIDKVVRNFLLDIRKGKKVTDIAFEKLPKGLITEPSVALNGRILNMAEYLSNWKEQNPNKTTVDCFKEVLSPDVISEIKETKTRVLAGLSPEKFNELTPDAKKELTTMAKKIFNMDLDLSSLETAKKGIEELCDKKLPEFINGKIFTEANAARLDSVLEKSKDMEPEKVTKMIADELCDVFKVNSTVDSLKDGAEKLAKLRKAGKWAAIGAGAAALLGGAYALFAGGKKAENA